MARLVYVLRGCLGGSDNDSNHRGCLLMIEEPPKELLRMSYSIYGRYYRFLILNARGSIRDALERMEHLIVDHWFDGDVLNMIVNPLEVRIEDIARAMYEENIEVQLLSEDDVEYSWE